MDSIDEAVSAMDRIRAMSRAPVRRALKHGSRPHGRTMSLRMSVCCPAPFVGKRELSRRMGQEVVLGSAQSTTDPDHRKGGGSSDPAFA